MRMFFLFCFDQIFQDVGARRDLGKVERADYGKLKNSEPFSAQSNSHCDSELLKKLELIA